MNPTTNQGPGAQNLPTPQNPPLGSSYPGHAVVPSDTAQATASSLPDSSQVGTLTPTPSIVNAPIAVADDRDLIERVWVEKAKHIASQTKGDPFEQSRQLTGLKVEYMKQRYNKNIRQDD